ncbi:MAG TPA: hypothetical protein ENJ32_12070 [Crenotrichaceae bacterium]|nr:hypothetical protein [Crenotrichaceae bacterium]
MTLKKIILMAYLAISLLIILLVSSIYLMTQNKIKNQRQQNILSMITVIAGSISNEAQSLSQWVEAVASDQAIINTFKAEDNQRKQKARELKNQTSGLLRIRLLLPGTNQIDESQTPHLGYADLELLQTAQSENPPPVIVQMNLPQAHIAIARAVYQNEKIVGTVLASFSTDRIKKFISTLPQQNSTIALFQENKKLASRGDSSILDTEPTGTLLITGTPWELRYWIRTPVDTNTLLYAAIALISSLVILAALSLWLLRKLNTWFESDISELKKLALDAAKGTKGVSYELNFSMFSDLIKHTRLLNIREISDGSDTIEVEITTEEEEEKRLAARGDELIRELDQQFAKADAMMSDLEDEYLGLSTKPDTKNNNASEIEVLSSNTVDIPVTPPLTTGIYGIIDKDFSTEYLKNTGRALGTELLEAGMTKIVVGVGHSVPCNKVLQGISSGLLTAGSKLLNLKRIASPVVAFSTQFPKDSIGIVVSNSLLPPNSCKLKFLFSGGYVSAELLERVDKRIQSESYIEGLGVSASSDTDTEADYIGAIVEDIHIHCNMKVAVISSSNSVRNLAGSLFKALGCDVVNMTEPVPVDNNEEQLFDHRNPSHLQQLCGIVTTEQVDLGIAYDTEGTGLAIIDSSGHIIWPDRVMMALTTDILQTFPGADILFDNDGFSALAKTVTRFSGKLLTHLAGEDVFTHLAPDNMPLAGNMDGQFVFADRWLRYPDALYASARLLEILSAQDLSSSEFFSELPDYVGTQPLFSAISENEAISLLAKWDQKLKQSSNTVTSTQHSLRVEVTKIGWIIVRYDKNPGGMVFRFQANSKEGLQTLMKSFKKLAPKNSALQLPF